METKIINTTPSAEAKTPATATTPATIAATTTAPVNTTATTPPAPATVPVSTTTAPSTMPPATGTPSTTPPATTASGTSSATIPATTDSAARLLDNYLKTGYYQGEGKGRYVDPALTDQAAVIGKALAESKVPPSAVNKMVRTLKAASRLPYAAQQGALKKLTPQVLDLENKKKAPPLLREVVERNQRAVQNEADFAACLDHFKDMSIFLASEQD